MRSIRHALTALLFAALIASTSVAMRSGAAATGKDVFTKNKCNTCHSISKQTIAAAAKAGVVDLSSVGRKRTAAWLEKYLMKNEAVNGKKHKTKFKGTAEELKMLSTWLASLK